MTAVGDGPPPPSPLDTPLGVRGRRCATRVIGAWRRVLEHNRDEEKEHASMVLEWIRRKDPSFSKELKDYLFTEKPIAQR
jgi:hypothetical protein